MPLESKTFTAQPVSGELETLVFTDIFCTGASFRWHPFSTIGDVEFKKGFEYIGVRAGRVQASRRDRSLRIHRHFVPGGVLIHESVERLASLLAVGPIVGMQRENGGLGNETFTVQVFHEIIVGSILEAEPRTWLRGATTRTDRVQPVSGTGWKALYRRNSRRQRR